MEQAGTSVRRPPVARALRLALIGSALALLRPAFAGGQETNIAAALPPVPAPEERRPSPARWFSHVVTRTGDRLDTYLANRLTHEEARRNEVFDRFYGDRQLEDENNLSRVRISPSVEYQDGDGEGVTWYLRTSLRLALPRSSGRLQLVFDSYDDEADTLDTALQRHPPAAGGGDDGRQTLGLRLSLRETLHYRASLETGLRFRPAPDPRAQLSLRVWRQVGPVVLRGTQRFFWELEDGFGEKTQLEVERGLNARNLVRATSAVIWSETSAGVAASEVLTFSHLLGRRRSISLTLGAASHLEPETEIDKYTIQIPYRLRLHREWLFMELTPGVDFPRARDFKESPFVILKFNFIFGHTEED